jgi:uncharacterized membrane protein
MITVIAALQTIGWMALIAICTVGAVFCLVLIFLILKAKFTGQKFTIRKVEETDHVK